MGDVVHVAPCHAYRYRLPGESDTEYGARLAAEFERELLIQGPETVLAFLAEPVVGATLGAVAAVEGYFKAIREICTRHGVLLILDEVMCGMGRTGHTFACEADGIAPDIIVMAKGLGAGYQPIGAVLVSDEIARVIETGRLGLTTGHTYMGHPVACAAALAVQEAIRDDGLVARVREMGPVFERLLREGLGDRPYVGDIRGRGFFRGIELVADRESRAPFPAGAGLWKKIKEEAFARGLICYPGGGTVDGLSGDHVLLAPPFIATEEELALAVDRLDRANKQGLVVVEGAWPVGIFDQAAALAARGLEPEERVEEAMNLSVLVLPGHIPLARAAAQALAMHVRRILILDDRGLRGIVSGLDFARAVG